MAKSPLFGFGRYYILPTSHAHRAPGHSSTSPAGPHHASLGAPHSYAASSHPSDSSSLEVPHRSPQPGLDVAFAEPLLQALSGQGGKNEIEKDVPSLKGRSQQASGRIDKRQHKEKETSFQATPSEKAHAQ